MVDHMPHSRLFIVFCCAICLVVFCDPALRAEEPQIRVAFPTQPRQVIKLSVEDYLLGVLAAEIPPSWPPEAVEAQAVASRSYALYRKAHPRSPDYDLLAGVSDQAYQFQDVYPPALANAVKTTRGRVLVWHGEVIPAFFHSCCGGHTEAASQVWTWATSYPFYQVKTDPYCALCPNKEWEYDMSKAELSLLLQMRDLAGGNVDQVIPLASDGSERTYQVAVITDAETIVLPSNRLRGLLGYDHLRSADFRIINKDDELIFLGKGNGHGVGLCQWGAYGMAEQGKSYRQILEFYYPGVELKKLY